MATPKNAPYKIHQELFRQLNKASNKAKHEKWKPKGEKKSNVPG